VFYCSVLREAIQFNIVPPLVAQNLTKNLEEFNWESFEICYQRELSRMLRQKITWRSFPWG